MLQKLLEAVYGAPTASKLALQLDQIIKEYTLGKIHQTCSVWHDRSVLYVTYPASFSDEHSERSLHTLARSLEHVKALGCDAIHVLPFLDSPLIDGGFDVADYYTVREDLGGGEGLDFFLAETRKLAIRPFNLGEKPTKLSWENPNPELMLATGKVEFAAEPRRAQRCLAA